MYWVGYIQWIRCIPKLIIMKTHLVFIIQAHDGESPDGHLSNYTELQLIDSTPESAEKRAKKIIKKKFYRLATVIEKEG